jgi:hypothetical protein
VNTLSIRTLGHLIAAATTHMSDSELRDLLMKSGLYDADIRGLDPWDLVDDEYADTPISNEHEMLRVPLLAARKAAKGGNRQAHDALLEIVRLSAEHVAAWNRRDAKTPLSALREALVSDGYELRLIVTHTNLDFGNNYEIQLLPLDPDAIPVSTEITALEAELDQRGYTEAREHYRLAVKHFTEQDHPSANGQLRNMLESLIINLARDHAGYNGSGKAGQGGQAIKYLYVPGGPLPAVVGDPLPERDGGGMLQGVWDILHSNGPHPGLSNADEARIRMQVCTALARFLLQHFR